jgi:hypothetical protein
MLSFVSSVRSYPYSLSHWLSDCDAQVSQTLECCFGARTGDNKRVSISWEVTVHSQRHTITCPAINC